LPQRWVQSLPVKSTRQGRHTVFYPDLNWKTLPRISKCLQEFCVKLNHVSALMSSSGKSPKCVCGWGYSPEMTLGISLCSSLTTPSCFGRGPNSSSLGSSKTLARSQPFRSCQCLSHQCLFPPPYVASADETQLPHVFAFFICRF
jgi:hypothetical protein